MLITVLITIAIIAAIVTIVLIVSTSGKKDQKSTKTNTNIQRKGKASVIKEYEKKLVHDPHNVAVVPGTCFGDGGEGFIRCCYATDINKIKIAMERLACLVKEKTGR